MHNLLIIDQHTFEGAAAVICTCFSRNQAAGPDVFQNLVDTVLDGPQRGRQEGGAS